MIGIIVTGHGEFATGLASAIELIAGRHENFETVDFPIHYANGDLADALEAAVNKLSPNCEDIIFCTDIAGGVPFNQSILQASKLPNAHVISGTNIPILLEALFSRINENATTLINILKDSHLSRIQVYTPHAKA